MTALMTRSHRSSRRRPATTPQRLRALATVAAAFALVFGVVVVQGVAALRGGLSDIGHQAGPQVVATSDVYFALNDMDAQVANVLLVGDEQDLGVGRARALAIYEQRRAQADADLQMAAAIGANDPTARQAIRAVLDALGRYEALAAQAVLVDGDAHHAAGRPPQRALVVYRQATDLLKTRLLPEVSRLTGANSATLERSYRATRSHTQWAAGWTVLAGLALAGTLAALQIVLARRFHRRFNPFLLLATLVAGLVTVIAAATFTAEAEHLRVAKKDAFDSVMALSQARSTGYDANADESRYLVDPARASAYEQAFLAKTQRLAALPGVSLADYPAALASARDAYRHDHTNVGWGGYLGTEFRNITFPGERDLAEQTLDRFLAYEQDDPHMRSEFRQGRIQDAVRFDTAYSPGNSNYDFGRFDQSLEALIRLNQSHFDGAVRAGENGLRGWNLIPWGAAFAVTVLAFAGVRPRLAEYR